MTYCFVPDSGTILDQLICMSVYMSACISQKPNVQASRNFLYMIGLIADSVLL